MSRVKVKQALVEQGCTESEGTVILGGLTIQGGTGKAALPTRVILKT